MKTITIISDGLVKKEHFIKALEKEFDINTYKINYFQWHEELNKAEFQNKIDYVEKNGPDFYDPPEDLLASIRESSYLFAHIAPINKKMLSVAKKLEIIGVCRGGTENIDLEYCKHKKIPVIRAVKNTMATAEFTVGLMLSITRNIANGYIKIKEGTWEKEYFNDGRRKSLQEMTIGLIGLGNIGREVGRILQLLGAEVLGYHPNLTEKKIAEIDLPIRYVSLDDLLKKSDIISIHLRLTNDTEGFISEKELSKMHRNTYLINTGRAGLVSEKEVIESLKKREILGAAFDVFWNEPIPKEHPLLQLDNVLLTPHIAGDTDVIDKAPTILLKEVKKYINTGHSKMIIKDKYMRNK